MPGFQNPKNEFIDRFFQHINQKYSYIEKKDIEIIKSKTIGNNIFIILSKLKNSEEGAFIVVRLIKINKNRIKAWNVIRNIGGTERRLKSAEFWYNQEVLKQEDVLYNDKDKEDNNTFNLEWGRDVSKLLKINFTEIKDIPKFIKTKKVTNAVFRILETNINNEILSIVKELALCKH